MERDPQLPSAEKVLPFLTTEVRRDFLIKLHTWNEETMHMSSVQQMTEAPSYQRLLDMGDLAIPLILEEMELEPQHLFTALTQLTGINPVEVEENVTVSSKKWVDWGREQGYLYEPQAVKDIEGKRLTYYRAALIFLRNSALHTIMDPDSPDWKKEGAHERLEYILDEINEIDKEGRRKKIPRLKGKVSLIDPYYTPIR